jgi:hypothetical protein
MSTLAERYHIAVRYKIDTDDHEINRVDVIDANIKSLYEVKLAVEQFNGKYDDYAYKLLNITDDYVSRIIAWLVNNRDIDINRHIEELREIRDRLDSIEHDIDYEINAIFHAIKESKND